LHSHTTAKYCLPDGFLALWLAPPLINCDILLTVDQIIHAIPGIANMMATKSIVVKNNSIASNQRLWRLRPALPGDATALHKACIDRITPDEIRRVITHCQNAARNNRGLGIVAELTDGSPVGYGQILRWARGAEISDLVVSQRWRGNGIGSAMIHQLIEVAREMRVPHVEIGVSLRNTSAYKLYRRLGFNDGRIIDIDLGKGSEPVMYMKMDLLC
jgi:ribosomal protein S18 acetylase RimI-like enzyme